MTTLADKGGKSGAGGRLHCPVRAEHVYPPLELALRDMRTANGRNATTGDGPGNESWIGLCLGMIVLDTLSGDASHVSHRFKKFLVDHAIGQDDAAIIWAVRCALLHGYGVPKQAAVGDRNVLLTSAVDAYAVDTSDPKKILLSVPVFCGQLVERIAAEAPDQWDTSLIKIDTNIPIGPTATG